MSEEWPLKFQLCTNKTHNENIPCCHLCPYCGGRIKSCYTTIHMLVCRDRKEKENDGQT